MIAIFLLSSCSSIAKEDNLRKECDKIEIVVENNDVENKLFSSNLEFSIKERFNLIFSGEEKIKRVNQRICYLKVNVEKTEYSVLTNKSGNIGRVNRKIKISYNFRSFHENLDDKFTIFYGSDVSNFVHSDYMKNKKEETNNIKIISNRLYFDILNRI